MSLSSHVIQYQRDLRVNEGVLGGPLLSIDHFVAGILMTELEVSERVNERHWPLLYLIFVTLNHSARMGRTVIELSATKITSWISVPSNLLKIEVLPDTELSALFDQLMQSPQAESLIRGYQFNNQLRLAQKRLYDAEHAILQAILTEPDAQREWHRHRLGNADRAQIIQWTARWFGMSPKEQAASSQCLAADNAARCSRTFITGGAGTGKTYTCARVAALLQTLALGGLQRPLRFSFAAPSGKAAQRITESLEREFEQLTGLHRHATDDAASLMMRAIAAIDTRAVTLHRLLKITPGRARSTFNQRQPLPFDVIIIDECSMVDLHVFQQLMLATSWRTRLIFVGDANQLPSVDTGRIFADLLTYLPGDYISKLTKNQRQTGPLAQLAEHVLLRQQEAIGQWCNRFPESLSWLTERLILNAFRDAFSVIEQHWPLADCTPEQQASLLNTCWQRLLHSKILTAVNQGPHGQLHINLRVERVLSKRFSFIRPGEHYVGKPIMLTENNYQLGIFNGDLGLLWPDKKGRLCAVFPLAGNSQATPNSGKKIGNRIANAGLTETTVHEGQPLSLSAFTAYPLQLISSWTTAYAMTVHKSQGSEFECVILCLPYGEQHAVKSNWLTQELLYTAVTRARQQLYFALVTADREAINMANEPGQLDHTITHLIRHSVERSTQRATNMDYLISQSIELG